MRDYQPKKNKYILPNALYNQILWQIRDYYRIKDEYNSIPEEMKSPSDNDGLPHGSPSFDGMDKKIIRMDRLRAWIEVIEVERNEIPIEYRSGVWDHIMYRKPYPDVADRSTFSRYKSRLIYNIAVRQGMIEA